MYHQHSAKICLFYCIAVSQRTSNRIAQLVFFVCLDLQMLSQLKEHAYSKSRRKSMITLADWNPYF